MLLIGLRHTCRHRRYHFRRDSGRTPNQDANPTDSITTNQKPSESDSTGNTDDTEKPTGSTENTENTDGTDPTEPDTGDDIKLDIDIDEAEKDVVKVEKPPEQITGPTDGSNPTDGNDISYGLFLSENSLSLKKGSRQSSRCTPICRRIL